MTTPKLSADVATATARLKDTAQRMPVGVVARNRAAVARFSS